MGWNDPPAPLPWWKRRWVLAGRRGWWQITCWALLAVLVWPLAWWHALLLVVLVVFMLGNAVMLDREGRRRG